MIKKMFNIILKIKYVCHTDYKFESGIGIIKYVNVFGCSKKVCKSKKLHTNFK